LLTNPSAKSPNSLHFSELHAEVLGTDAFADFEALHEARGRENVPRKSEAKNRQLAFLSTETAHPAGLCGGSTLYSA